MPNETELNRAAAPEAEPTVGRKVGVPRFFELMGRDLWSFYRAGFLCVLAYLPGAAVVGFGLLVNAPLLCLLGGPFLSGLLDTVLRALRDEPGYWWHTYKRAWKQNWRQSLLPGALLGLFLGGWSWMLRSLATAEEAPGTGAWVAAAVSVFVCTGFLAWLLAQVPLVDLPLGQLLKNAGLMFFGFFPRTAAAALVLAVYWGLTLLFMPATILVVLLFGFWLPAVIALMILYPGLDKAFALEKTLRTRREAGPDAAAE